MKIKMIICLALFSLMISCTKEETTIPEPPVVKDNAVLLTQLKGGQTATFLRYQTTCDNQDRDFAYTGDSLILTVLDKDGQLYFEERITDHSPMLANDWIKQTIQHIVHSDGQRVLIPERFESQLFFFFGNDTIPVLADHNVGLNQSGCKLHVSNGPFIGNEIGKVNRFKVGDIVQENKRSVSCVPMFELDAYLIYDDQQLYQSHTIRYEHFNGETLTDIIEGWVLLN